MKANDYVDRNGVDGVQTEHHEIIVLDFGGQYNQLIARRIRELGVYSELLPHTTTAETLRERQPKGIILSGGPHSVHDDDAPWYDKQLFELGIPILGLCYGMQLLAAHFGGVVERALHREYGKADIRLEEEPSDILQGVPDALPVWMSHGDLVKDVPRDFQVDAVSPSCPVAAMSHPERLLYGIQFHPEVRHTEKGMTMLQNFAVNICQCRTDWTMAHFVEEEKAKIKQAVGDSQVICALSGGVDSSVAATLVHEAIGDQLTCIFVDHGLLRQGETESVLDMFSKQLDMNIVHVDAKDRFLNKLAGVSDPEQKRKIIGNEFIYILKKKQKIKAHRLSRPRHIVHRYYRKWDRYSGDD